MLLNFFKLPAVASRPRGRVTPSIHLSYKVGYYVKTTASITLFPTGPASQLLNRHHQHQQRRTYYPRYLYYPWQARVEDDEYLAPPSSEKSMYTNLFDQADNPKLFELDNEMAPTHAKLNPTDDIAELPTPNLDPHRFTHSHPDPSMMYNAHYEPPFPRAPNLEAGELAVGANLVRTSVWHTPNEPAITSIARFEPRNFQAAGFAENVIPLESSIPSYYHDHREARLAPGHVDRRPWLYFVQAAYLAGAAAVVRQILYWALAQFFTMEPGAFWPKPVEINYTKLAPGEQMLLNAAGTQVFIRHREDQEIRQARADDALAEYFRDPELDTDRCPDPEWLFCSAICTHLGCLPHRGGEFGGWLCPCHGSHYDASGRIRLGPAPKNLPVASYEHVGDSTILVGKPINSERRWT